MNTTNHKKLSEVGEKVLRQALARVGRKDMRLGAMELGNWLTDVSQCVDKVAYADVHELVKGWLADLDRRKDAVFQFAGGTIQDANAGFCGLFQKFHYDCPSWVDAPFQALQEKVDALHAGIDKAYRNLLTTLEGVFADGGRLESGFRALFGFVGFYKHAYPLDGSGVFRIESDAYFGVFEKRYTQYLPHEHLDRPEQIGHRQNEKKDKYAAKTDRKLYTYLRRDMKALAGHFACLDGGPKNLPAGGHSWAQATFSPGISEFQDDAGKHEVDDKDVAWNMNLARLGHALHGVEDYFAHSIFLDIASTALPSYCLVERAEDTHVGPSRHYGHSGLTPSGWDFSGPHIAARRLKKWRNGFDDTTQDWRLPAAQGGLDDEHHVVTGYFDFQDTVVSITHALDEALERPSNTVGRDVDETWKTLKEYQYRKLLDDTLDLVADPLGVWKKNDPDGEEFDEDNENLAVRIVRKKLGKSAELMEGKDQRVNVAIQLVLDGPLANQPAQVKQYFRDAVRIFGQAVGAAMAGKKLWGALKEVRNFLADPLAWLGAFIGKEAAKFLKEHGEVYLKNALWAWVGSQRIGSHSLLAKDGGRELFFKGGMDCARAAHWYVTYTLVRHARPRSAAIAPGKPRGSTNLLYTRSYVDWLELLEYWLDHPFAKTQVQQKGTRTVSGPIHIKTRRDPHSRMSPDSLASLAEKYRPTFDRNAPGAPPEFTWETIADANLPLAGLHGQEKKRRINNVLLQRKQGVLVSDGLNAAFVPDLPLVIPFQKYEQPTFESPEIDRRWWHPVLVEKGGYKNVVAWYDDRGNRAKNAPPFAHHPKYVTLDESKKLVREADELRAKLTQEYVGLRDVNACAEGEATG